MLTEEQAGTIEDIDENKMIVALAGYSIDYPDFNVEAMFAAEAANVVDSNVVPRPTKQPCLSISLSIWVYINKQQTQYT